MILTAGVEMYGIGLVEGLEQSRNIGIVSTFLLGYH